MIRVFLAALLLCVASTAHARHKHHRSHPVCTETGTVMKPSCMGQDFLSGIRSIKVTLKRVSDAGSIVSHPDGCPARAFCGCGAVDELKNTWGLVLRRPRELWLAANWFRFPRTSPAPGMVAVRRHHVMVLQASLGDGVWQVYDANSGGHRTRIHARSIAGFAIVNPRAG